MSEDKSRDIEKTRKSWDKHAERYDDWYNTFEGAVEHHVDWELLKQYLPENKDARILDAAGGTGRITLPLAKMGYSVTLCDVSRGMLDMARQRLVQEGVSNKVDTIECDICKLGFDDECFDFVLCWNGMSKEAARELIRVTKKGGGTVSLYLSSRCSAAMSKFSKNPDAALSLLGLESNETCRDVNGYAYEPLTVNVDEAREFFKKEGIEVCEIYAVCGMLEFLAVPEEIRKAREWDIKLFNQTTEMLLRLGKEPSAKGLSRHLVLYGIR